MELEWDLGGADFNVRGLVFSPDSTLLFGTSSEITINPSDSSAISSAWALLDRKVRWQVELRLQISYFLGVAGDGSHVIAGTDDGLSLLAMDRGTLTRQIPLFEGLPSHFLHLAISSDGKYWCVGECYGEVPGGLATGELSREIVIIDSNSQTVVARWKAHDRSVTYTVFSAGDTELYSVGNDKMVRRWDLAGHLLGEWSLGSRLPRAMFVIDGILTVLDDDGTIWRWSLSDFEPLPRLQQRLGTSRAACVSPSGRTMAVTIGPGDWLDAPGQVRLYDTTTWEAKMTLAVDNTPNSCCFSPDGRMLAVGTNFGGHVYLWSCGERDFAE